MPIYSLPMQPANAIHLPCDHKIMTIVHQWEHWWCTVWITCKSDTASSVHSQQTDSLHKHIFAN